MPKSDRGCSVVDVFLSYSRQDSARARQIERGLTAAGYVVFWDQVTPPGADWDTWIRGKLSAARTVVVLWSKASISSPNVRHEAVIGRDAGKLVPVLLDPLSPPDFPMGLYLVQSVALSGWQGDAGDSEFQRLLIGVGAHAKLRAFPEMLLIPAGEFLMGSPQNELGRLDWEGPQHRVRLNYEFELGKYQITFAEWDAAIAGGAKLRRPDDKGWGRDHRPVIDVSWEDAHTYIAWLNNQTSGGYRLPSEAEWEYSCRAGTASSWSYGDDDSELGKHAWFGGDAGNSDRKTHSVGVKRPNPFGLFDMHGNVWEWCKDSWHDNYVGAPNDGSAWTTGGDTSLRSLRGGSSSNGPLGLRSAGRARHRPNHRSKHVGFRIARTL